VRWRSHRSGTYQSGDWRRRTPTPEKPMAEIRIGTSGYHYKHWLGRYYPEGTKLNAMLAHYLRDFDTVELNNTFYQLPNESTFDS
jgi:hypothetical protein